MLGPGLDDWPRTAAVLRGESDYVPARCALPVPSALPAAERRRTGVAVRIALAVATAACEAAQRAPSSLATVFAASGGDGDNCHAICEVLASERAFYLADAFSQLGAQRTSRLLEHRRAGDATVDQSGGL